MRLPIEMLDEGRQFKTCVTNRFGVVVGRLNSNNTGVPVKLWGGGMPEEFKSLAGHTLVMPK